MSHAADTRDHILRMAAQVLAEQPETVQMADIAAAAGVGRATLYRHFDSREALVCALAEHANQELADALAGAQLHSVPAREALDRLVRVTVNHMHAHGYLLFERAADPDRARERLESSGSSRVDELIGQLFERCVAEGVIRDDLPLEWTAPALFGLAMTAVRTYGRSVHDLDHAAWLTTTIYLQGAAPHTPPHLTEGPTPS